VSGGVSVIAIDGPVAAGKTVVGRELARCLGFRYLDTGIMYRAVGWLSRQQGLHPDDEEAMGRLAQSTSVRTISEDSDQVLVDAQQVGPELHTPEIALYASLVATIPEVRRAMVREQRAMAAEGDIVMVGRDIGTVVSPDADLKIFLTASVEERARRRWRQFRREGREVDYAEVLQETRARDRRDSTRADSPLLAAPDAVTLETDHLSVDQVVGLILEHVRQHDKVLEG
jgi:cytidylate kinase